MMPSADMGGLTATTVVLVVEDEVLIQHIVEDALVEGGFDLIIASSAKEAFGIIDSDKPIKALLTDVNLGQGSTGWEVARHAREKYPQLPVVYMTGDGGGDWNAQGVPHSVILVKPFVPAQIVTAVAQLLNAVPPTASKD